MNRLSGEDRKKSGSRSEFIQSLSLNKKDPKDLLENILGKQVQIKDFLKVSTQAATSNLSQSKSVRFSFAKDDPESASQKLSLKARDSNKPIKSALLIKNPKFPQPKILTEEERRSHVDNFDHEFMDKHIKGLVLKEMTHRSKLKLQIKKPIDSKDSPGVGHDHTGGMNASPSKEKFLRSLTENQKHREKSEDEYPDLQLNTQTLPELKNSQQTHSAPKRRYSVEGLDATSKKYRSSLLLETDLDKHCFSDPEEEIVKVGARQGGNRDKDGPNTPIALRINKQLSKLQTNSDSSTNCGVTQLKSGGGNTPGVRGHDILNMGGPFQHHVKDSDYTTAENSRVENKHTPIFGHDSGNSFKKLTLNGMESEVRDQKFQPRPDTFTIKEEPSCAEELLTPNASARFESISNLEDENSRQLNSNSGAIGQYSTTAIKMKRSTHNRFNTFNKILNDPGLNRGNTLQPRSKAPTIGESAQQDVGVIPPPALTLTYNEQEAILEEDYSLQPCPVVKPPLQLETIKESESDEKKSFLDASYKSLRGQDTTNQGAKQMEARESSTPINKTAKQSNQCCNLI